MEERKALIVGIDEYPSAPLSGCVNDATSIASLLKINEDGSPNFDTKLQKNVCTKGRLKILVQDLFKGNSDVALFYFSGHGSIEENQGYIVTPDFSPGDIGISTDDILTMANKSSIKNKIIILDSCFSGNLGTAGALNSSSSILGEGVTIMTASSKDEVSIENNGHGVFTSLFIQALAGYAADITGNVTPAGIYAFIDQALGAWSQRPIFKTNTQNFYYLRKVTPKIKLSTLRKIKDYFSSEKSEFKLDPSFEFTNNPHEKHDLKTPYAIDKNVKVFKDLQLYQKVGLVEPSDEDYMYFAAMNSKSCHLTSLGKRYFKLAKEGKI